MKKYRFFTFLLPIFSVQSCALRGVAEQGMLARYWYGSKEDRDRLAADVASRYGVIAEDHRLERRFEALNLSDVEALEDELEGCTTLRKTKRKMRRIELMKGRDGVNDEASKKYRAWKKKNLLDAYKLREEARSIEQDIYKKMGHLAIQQSLRAAEDDQRIRYKYHGDRVLNNARLTSNLAIADASPTENKSGDSDLEKRQKIYEQMFEVERGYNGFDALRIEMEAFEDGSEVFSTDALKGMIEEVKGGSKRQGSKALSGAKLKLDKQLNVERERFRLDFSNYLKNANSIRREMEDTIYKKASRVYVRKTYFEYGSIVSFTIEVFNSGKITLQIVADRRGGISTHYDNARYNLVIPLLNKQGSTVHRLIKSQEPISKYGLSTINSVDHVSAEKAGSIDGVGREEAVIWLSDDPSSCHIL